MGASFDAATIAKAWAGQRVWQQELAALFDQVDFLVTPTLTIFPPALDDGNDLLVARCTIPVNLAGVPALALPVPTSGPLPASIQLIGPAGSEEQLLAAGTWLESAIASG
jgi:amidase